MSNSATTSASGSITRVGVIGLGTMGAGIAEVIARSGAQVWAVEATEVDLVRGVKTIEGSTTRAVAKGKLSEEERTALLARITFTTSLNDLSEVDLVVEAVPESMEIKSALFAALDGITPPHAILASNTSSLSVTEISVATGRPSQVVGLHFFNPAPVQAFVEIVRTVVSSPEVVDAVAEFARGLGKEPVVVGDKAGFIANALLFGYLNHAVKMYEQKYATREDIDASMRLGCGLPMGPLALLDLIGLDTAYEILDTMYKEGRDRLHAPSPIIKQMVTAGLRGRKSGRGFYTYEAQHSPVVIADAQTPDPNQTGGPTRTVNSVGVIGSGTMATGIAEVFAKAGLDVIYVARTEDKVKAVRGAIEKSLEKAVQRGKLDEAGRYAALAHLVGSTKLDDLAKVDLVVEAIVEELSVKLALFRNLDEICKPGAILATTTSSLPVVEMAAATSRPHDVVGLHFFNPASVMKLVEIVSTVATADEVITTSRELCLRIGKHPVVCADRAGFIVNALLFPYLNDAIRMLEM
ncbi:MAG: 3-hydroxybutyryl-CoA dehydrogenase, partial [Actinobacteria bacterium]